MKQSSDRQTTTKIDLRHGKIIVAIVIVISKQQYGIAGDCSSQRYSLDKGQFIVTGLIIKGFIGAIA